METEANIKSVGINENIKEVDLIELLWRQDMDMGVPREMFDPIQRLQLEKDAEIELQNKRVKEKELELLKLKQQEEEDRKQAELNENIWQNITYTVDGETGEFVAQPLEEAIARLPNLANSNEANLTDFNVDDAMQLLEQQNTSSLQRLIENQGNTTLQSRMNDIVATVEKNTTSSTEPAPPFNRQMSIEQRWQDVASLLELPAASTTAPPTSEQQISGLIQNATFAPTPAQTDLDIPEPPTNIAISPNSSEDGIFDLDSDPELLFPDMTQSTNGSQAFDDQPGSFLDDLLDNEMDDMSLPNMTATEGMHGVACMDDASSDSAVSMGSSSPHQDWQDSGSNAAHSPYDMLEGAAGMDFSTGYTKPNKFEYYDNDPSYADQNYIQNDYQNASMNSSYYNHHNPPKLRHVNHNHTYTVEPGMVPRESRRAREEREKQQRNSLSRDEKRAKALKIPFSISEVINSPVEDFNELLHKYPLNDNQMQLIRDIRRRGKNKVAAQNCRKRKLGVILSLDDEIKQLQDEREQLMKDRCMIDKESNKVKSHFNHLYQEIFQSLRDDNGHPYNPQEYSLQQTADGNVFLVPRNKTAKDHKDAHSRKRRPNCDK